MSEDPIGFHSNDTNIYRYIYSNPVTSSDPRGYQAAAVVMAPLIIGGTRILAGMCITNALNELAKISEKKKQCLQLYNDRMAACSEKPSPVKEDCVKVSGIAFKLCSERAEGGLK